MVYPGAAMPNVLASIAGSTNTYLVKMFRLLQVMVELEGTILVMILPKRNAATLKLLKGLVHYLCKNLMNLYLI